MVGAEVWAGAISEPPRALVRPAAGCECRQTSAADAPGSSSRAAATTADTSASLLTTPEFLGLRSPPHPSRWTRRRLRCGRRGPGWFVARRRVCFSSVVAAEDAASLSGRVRINPELGDTAIRNAGRVPGEQGVFDVIGHGTPNELGGMSPAEVAGDIRGTPSWGGQDVRLLSCSTGCPTGSFAHDLANELGVGVKAPTTDIYVSSRGGITFGPGGERQWFHPASAAP